MIRREISKENGESFGPKKREESENEASDPIWHISGIMGCAIAQFLRYSKLHK